MIFTIPFVFAIYPELLLIDKAVMDPKVPGMFLDGYDGNIQYQALALLLIRVILAMYFVSSSLAGYDARALSPVEIGLRLVVAALILFKPIEVYGPAVLAWFAIMAVHYLRARRDGGDDGSEGRDDDSVSGGEPEPASA